MGATGVVTVGPGGAKLPPELEPSTILRAQVNRFMGPGVPKQWRFREQRLPEVGPVDMGLAIHAVAIVQKRAAEAYEKDPAGAKDLLNRANTGFADPVGFVNKNFDMVLQTVTIYGDIHGLPKATIGGGGKGIPIPLLIGLVAAVLFVVTRKKK
jgi:hypothetical protein